MNFSNSALSTNSFSHSFTVYENELCPSEDESFDLCKEYKYESSENDEDELKKSVNHYEKLAANTIKKLSLCETILQESKKESEALYEWQRENKKSETVANLEDNDSPVKYLNDKIFPILLPIMEQLLIEACRWNALENPKCLFNGLDFLAQHLWNKNPQHPERNTNSLQLFDIPQFKLWLKEHPRPIYPKSWQWTKEQAALYIQKYVRGWIVRKRNDVQELRQFWKALAAEKLCHDIKSIQSTDQSLTASVSFIPEKMQELNICDRYKLLSKFYTKT